MVTSNHVDFLVRDTEPNIIASSVEHGQTEAFLRFEYPAQITAPTDKLKLTHRTFSGFRFLERLEQSKAVKHLERFEPNPGWLARGIDFS
jgi:hypothetical protein